MTKKLYIPDMFLCWRHYQILCTALACLLMLSGCLYSPFKQKTDYKIQGIENQDTVQSALQKTLNENLIEDIDYEAGSEDFQRAEASREALIERDLLNTLVSKGYYDAHIDYHDNPDESLRGVYNVNLGALYTISKIRIGPKTLYDPSKLRLLKKGDALDARKILEQQTALHSTLSQGQCYLSLKVDHLVHLDHFNKSAVLDFSITEGPQANFGPVSFAGLDTVDLSFLKKIIPWQQGECFQKQSITKLRTQILETGLFVRTDVKIPEKLDSKGQAPIAITLKERAHRSLKAGASYYTDEGAGVVLGWEHRNILGSGELFQAELSLNELKQNLNVDFTKPYFLRNDQTFFMNTALRAQDTDAYEETAYDIGASVKRQLTQSIALDIGSAFTFSEIEDQDGKDSYALFSFPISAVFDNRDSPLDPHKGLYLKTNVEPFYEMLGESDPFTKIEAGARTYLHLLEGPDLVWAFRGNIGSIIGKNTAQIPTTERFFAGGSGSIRGFEYQKVGPFDDGDPIGGRSFIAGSSELRLKFTNTIGAVAFVDAGNVSENTEPDFSAFSIGAGAGLRYYTNFGPMRFDIATPLNKKENLDQNYQFYISIGQAF